MGGFARLLLEACFGHGVTGGGLPPFLGFSIKVLRAHNASVEGRLGLIKDLRFRLHGFWGFGVLASGIHLISISMKKALFHNPVLERFSKSQLSIILTPRV